MLLNEILLIFEESLWCISIKNDEENSFKLIKIDSEIYSESIFY